MEDLKKVCSYANDEVIKIYYYYEYIKVDKVRNAEFYKNEIEAYEVEKSLFIDDMISESYRIKRDIAMWNYRERLKILNNNN